MALNGFTAEQVLERRAQYGENRLPSEKGVSAWMILVNQLKSPLVYIILAAAGVKRLGWREKITEIIPPDISLPAIGQGAIGIECRISDEWVNNLIAALNHRGTYICVKAERAFLKKLEGGCQVPIAAHARLTDGRIVMHGLVGSISGDRIIKANIEGDPMHADTGST